MPWLHALTVLVCLCCNCVFVCGKGFSLDLHRLVEFDIGRNSYGSQISSVSQFVCLLNAPLPHIRAAVLVPFDEVDKKLVEGIVSNSSRYAAVVFVLSSTSMNPETPERAEAIKDIERVLLSNRILLPVYFTQETPELSALMASLHAQQQTGQQPQTAFGGTKLVAKMPHEPMRKPLHNLLGTILGGSPGRTDPENRPLPTIVFVAHWGSFATSPAFATGATENGSGVVLLLQLARMFSRLYNRGQERPEFDLQFLLSAGGHLGFVGSRVHAQGLSQFHRNQVRLVVCLDAVSGESPTLQLLHTRTTSDPSLEPWYDALVTAADTLQIVFESSHKKTQASARYLPWEHEVWQHEGLTAVTLTRRTTVRGRPLFNTALDRKPLDVDQLSQAAQLVFTAVHSVILPGSAPPAIAPSQRFLERWADVIRSEPRMEPFVGADSQIFGAFEKVLRESTSSVRVLPVPLEPQTDPVFFSGVTAEAALVDVSSLWFEVAYAGFVITWNLLCYLAVTVVTRGKGAILQDLQLLQPKIKTR